ncbi:MAG: putative glycoside hydrolase [Candidatus Pacebacteria bacterium]|nr:putative glycoside hydrolase [Candidatus Paceibacterota bacterium]
MKNKIFIILFLIFCLGFLLLKNNILNREIPIARYDQDLFLKVDKIRDIKVKRKHVEMPESVRAVYMSSWIGGSKKLRSKLIDFIDSSRINAVVLDIKDYSGLIAFPIDNSLINEYDTDGKRIPDIENLIKELHDRDIYIIGRLTTFQDPLLAKVKPEFAFKRKDNGKIWKDRKGLAFIDPQKKDAWNYYAVIAEESYKIGFDEINFDYIRYPSDGNIANLDTALNGNTKMEAMKEFYIFLDERLRTQGIPISADLFGFTASLDNGLSIGQNLNDALQHFDVIAPMVYPSHYPKKYLGFSNSAEHPYEVVYHEMNLARKKAIALGLPKSSLRTWIQDFDLGASYGLKEVQDQIKASYNAGVPSYMVWDPNNRYTKSAYYTDFSSEWENTH